MKIEALVNKNNNLEEQVDEFKSNVSRLNIKMEVMNGQLTTKTDILEKDNSIKNELIDEKEVIVKKMQEEKKKIQQHRESK